MCWDVLFLDQPYVYCDFLHGVVYIKCIVNYKFRRLLLALLLYIFLPRLLMKGLG